MTKLPAWARWNEAAADTPWTVGIEEEVMLLDPRRTWSLANRIDEVLAALPPGIAAHASAETHACVVELRTARRARAGAAPRRCRPTRWWSASPAWSGSRPGAR